MVSSSLLFILRLRFLRFSHSVSELFSIETSGDFIGTSENLGIDLKYPLWITTYNSFYLTSSYYHKKLSNSRLNIMTIDKSSDTISFSIEGVYNGISNDSFSYSANVSYGNVKDGELLY